MARTYRKRPVVIEAEQWDGTASSAGRIIDWALALGGTIRYRDHAGAPGCLGAHENGPFRYCDQRGCDWLETGADLAINTLEGTMTASPGDWIIRGVAGEFYACKPDIFEATYEAVEDPR